MSSHREKMTVTRDLAVIATFTALSVGSDLALTDFPNVKLVDPIVFAVAFVFGLQTGVYVGVLSELIWGTISPYGFGGYIIPFLVAGEVLFALAGWGASRIWREGGARLSARNFYLGAVLALCAFLWDLETNAGTALLAFWPSISFQNLITTEVFGLPFMVAHEVSDLVTGATLAPLIIFYASRVAKPRKLPLVRS
ncbi:MAG: hypothetical protein OK455_03990 [Thaumarchaeota archaeon]|nr:hypothetical protein [Nitrososphaerota archaeon]